MGASVGGGKSRGRKSRFSRSGGRSGGVVSDINVTPLVDVMLVLLIVFMVAAPMMTTGVPVQLPKTAAKPLEADPETPLTISLDKGGKIFVQQSEISQDQLVPKLKAILATRKPGNDRLYLKADQTVDYGQVMVIMGHLNASGFTKIGLVTEPKGTK
jgi:biopolymer transport protein TolR